ncbi:hypothetical protein [Hydrogenoanaerobacterium sp.]|uniref:hypothetical protein n=1 Tax=Hydrogenoanaerobacterium sp. TaxID=2953763 RepID=UPI00289C862B|nr:hypothetical protein [Hydrogenoanaerobacterium sp.]
MNTIEIDKQEAEQGKVLSIFAYISLLFLIPLLAGKENKFAQYHANQGLVLFLTAVALGIVTNAVAFILPFLSVTISGVGSLAIFILAILGIVNVCKLEAKPLPFIGNITLIKSY